MFDTLPEALGRPGAARWAIELNGRCRAWRRTGRRRAGDHADYRRHDQILQPRAKQIAATTGIEETIVGVVLVAISTSLPELVASLAALRIGAYDLAMATCSGATLPTWRFFAVRRRVHARGRCSRRWIRRRLWRRWVQSS
jgi:hypothetical protein